MSDFWRGLLQGLFGPRDEDPLGSITPDQMAIVLRSIEEKFNLLQEENTRLRSRLGGGQEDRDALLHRIEAQQREIASLRQALAEQTAAEPLVDDAMLAAALAPVLPQPAPEPLYAGSALLSLDTDPDDDEEAAAEACAPEAAAAPSESGVQEAVGA